jgi:hypothetical protein
MMKFPINMGKSQHSCSKPPTSIVLTWDDPPSCQLFPSPFHAIPPAVTRPFHRGVEAPAFTATVPTGFVTAMMHWAMPLRLGRRGGNSMGNAMVYFWVTAGKKTSKHDTKNVEK